MKKFQRFVSKVSGSTLFKFAALMLVLSELAVTRCVVPYWHNEPEMPQSMLDEIHA